MSEAEKILLKIIEGESATELSEAEEEESQAEEQFLKFGLYLSPIFIK